MRVPQTEAVRGSQKWLQLLVNTRPELFNKALSGTALSGRSIEWTSPLRDDQYAEYRDAAFLDRVAAKLEIQTLKGFWPARGPCWDGLARSSDGEPILVEAKAHIAEMASPATAARGDSLALIEQSLQRLKEYLGVTQPTNWARTLYQYTNRLAHLYLLRVLNDVPAHLIFLYFVGDADMKGPSTSSEWAGAIRLAHAMLGLPHRHRLSSFIHDVFIDVKSLSPPT